MKINVDIVVMDYDRTVADEGLNFKIADEVKRALDQVSQKIILATGRMLDDIPDRDVLELFDALVVENGTVLVTEKGQKKEILVNKEWPRIKEKIIELLKEVKINFHHGEVILFGSKKDLPSVRQTLEKSKIIKETFIDLNKDGYMILPAGWNKGKGAKFAATRLGGGKIMAIGDEINDLSLFEIADIKVAVGNAIPELKRMADIICDHDNGRGVVEILRSLRCY